MAENLSLRHPPAFPGTGMGSTRKTTTGPMLTPLPESSFSGLPPSSRCRSRRKKSIGPLFRLFGRPGRSGDPRIGPLRQRPCRRACPRHGEESSGIPFSPFGKLRLRRAVRDAKTGADFPPNPHHFLSFFQRKRAEISQRAGSLRRRRAVKFFSRIFFEFYWGSDN